MSPLPHQPYRNLPAVLFVLKELGDDIHRNWGVQERIVACNPCRMWKTLTYLGASFFFVAAFLAYHQGVWLSLFFIAFAPANGMSPMAGRIHLLRAASMLLASSMGSRSRVMAQPGDAGKEP